MNLKDALEIVWGDLSESISADGDHNPSVIAFQFCEAFSEAIPDLKISYDNRDIPNDPDRPNLVFWSENEQPEIQFLGRLIVDTADSFSPKSEIANLLKIIKQKQFNVLQRDNDTGKYLTPSIPISEDFQFGLLIITGKGKAGYDHESFTRYLPDELLNRFLFAQNSTEQPGFSKRASTFEMSEESNQRKENKDLGLSFDIDSGRTLYVDFLTIETTLSEWSVDDDAEHDLPLVVKRGRVDWKFDHWFDPDGTHFILPHNFSDSGALVSVILFSEPISEDHNFSELMVVFYLPFVKETSIKNLMLGALHDLDWENLAIDRIGKISKLPKTVS